MNHKEMSTSKEYSRLDAQQFKGKLHYKNTLPILALKVYGIFDEISIAETIILDFLYYIYKYYLKRGKKPSFTYNYLMDSLPMLKKVNCYSKASISRVINRLAKYFDLIELSREDGHAYTFSMTSKGIEIMEFKPNNSVSDNGRSVSAIEKQGISVSENHSVSAKEKRGVPAKEKPNNINNRDNDNLTIVEQSDSDTITEEKIKKYRDEALENFQSLEPEEKMLYDSLAYNLLDFSCPKPKPNTVEMKRLRVQRYIYDNDL